MIPPQQPRKNYDDGGMVSTQEVPQGVGGPTQLSSQRPQGGQALTSGMSNLGTNVAGADLNVLAPYLSNTGIAKQAGNAIGGTVGSFLSPFMNNFQATAAPIQGGTNADQLNQAYQQTQSGLGQQQGLVQALNAQNGLGNQSNVFNQFQGVANGQGPNPALAQLRQQTGNNIAQQNALMAGQRGSGANAGMMARQAAQQGANIQQNAAGQAAALQAQQQLNALSNMGNIANTQAANQMAGIQGLNNAAQNEQQILQNANAGYNSNLVNMQNGMNQVNAGVASGNQNAMGQMLGGAMSGGGITSMLAKGGEVKNYDTGGPVEVTEPNIQPGQASVTGPQSSAGQWLNSNSSSATSAAPSYTAPAQTDWGLSGKGKSGGGGGAGGLMSLAALAEGGKVPAMVSPGEQYIPPKDVEKVKKGANPLAVGERIPGKPKHKGDDYDNDTVPKTLQEGGFVIPNSIMQSKDAAKKASAFIHAHLAKNGKLPKKPDKK